MRIFMGPKSENFNFQTAGVSDGPLCHKKIFQSELRTCPFPSAPACQHTQNPPSRHVRHSQERKWCTMDYHVTTICNNGRTPNCFGPDKDTAKGREIAAAPSIRCQCPSRVFTMDIHFDAPTALTLGCGALFLGREFCRSKVYPGHWGHCAIGRIRFKEANHPSVKSPVMPMNGSEFN